MNRIWQGGAFRNLPVWLAISAISVSVLLGFLFWRTAARTGELHASTTPLILIFWLAVAVYLLFGKPGSRGHQLELALPIPARVLWRRHFLATLLGALVTLAAALGVLFLHGWLLNRVGRETVIDVPVWPLLGILLSGTLLATALVDAIEPGLWKPGDAKHYWRKAYGWMAAVPAALVLLNRWPAVAVTACVAITVVVVHRSWRAVPEAYRFVSTEPTEAEGRRSRVTDASLAATGSRPTSRWTIYRTVYSVLHTAPPWNSALAPWLLYFFVALMGFILAGGADYWFEAEELRFLYLPFGAYMLIAGLGILTYHLHRFDPLPIPRRTLFAVMTVPGLVVYCAGYAAGLLLFATNPQVRPMVDYRVVPPRVEFALRAGPGSESRELDTRVWVEVDPGFMGVTLAGNAPTLTSPSGESHPAWSEPLLRGAPIAIYNPYNTPEETSADFEAWMTSSAIEAVYGKRIAPDEIRERYFEVEEGRVVGLQGLKGRRVAHPLRHPEPGFGSLLLSDRPELEPPRKGPETPVYMTLVLIPWLLLTAFIVSSFRATHSVRYIRWMYWVALGLLMSALLLQVLLAAFDLYSLEAARTMLAVLIRQLGSSPLARGLTWIVSLAGIALSYRFALQRFERAEIPASPINCSWMDWGTDR